MIAADVAFRQAANAANAMYEQAPPYLSYKTDVIVDIPSLHQHRMISRAVETRTKDDFAVLQDLPQGQRQYAHSFPLIPTFDALSYFRVVYNGARRNALSYVQLEKTLTFSDPAQSATHSDVIVTYLRYYRATYAPDSNDRLAHIVMEPLPTLTTNNNSDFYLHDVYVDTSTNLPTRVTYTGPVTNLAVDYAVVQNHWLVNHVTYNHTFFGPMHIGRVTANVEATNSSFAFPEKPSDGKLARPLPSSSPPSK